MPSARKPYPDPRLYKKQDGIFDWQPGNGTRYYIALTQTGHGPLLTWLCKDDIGGTSFLFIDVTQKSVGMGYFMEKTKLTNEEDARALLEFAIYMEVTKDYW